MGKFLSGVACIGVVGVFIVTGWAGQFNHYVMTGFFAPKYEEVRRSTFEQSQTYVEGQRRDLANLEIEWTGATGDQKAVIRATALNRIAGLPDNALNAQILAFRQHLMGSN